MKICKIHVDSRRKSEATLHKLYPGAELLDVTSRGPTPWVRLSPFFPHGGIPLPFSPGLTAMSVEGVWQGLKVFETADVDQSKFTIDDMKGIKRTVRKNGRCLGHRRGAGGERLLDYLEARWQIYLPTYLFMLDHKAADVVAKLRALADRRPLVLLDYETNGDVADLSKPLSHAALIARYLNDDWPRRSDSEHPSSQPCSNLDDESP